MTTPILTALTAFVTGATVSAVHAAGGIETPTYEVVASEPAQGAPGETIELRRYEPMIVAEVTVTADSRDAASSKGFRPLADFIFGANDPGTSLAMTAPVTTAPAEGDEGERIDMTAPVSSAPAGEGGRYTVRFMMPSEYTMATLPAPLDPDVRINEVPARTLVALRFVGERSAERVAAAEAAVSGYVEAAGLSPTGPFATAGYDGPDTPVPEKRWEVQRPVASADPALE
jgi:hypothetical protein